MGRFPIRVLGIATLVCLGASQGHVSAAGPVADTMPEPLARRGDAVQGRQIALARDRGNCGACHVVPGPEQATHGNVGPSLQGVADRLTEGQIRMRIVDARRLNPRSIMPSYFKVEGLRRVGAAYAGRPALSAAEIEDLVAFLGTLRGSKP